MEKKKSGKLNIRKAAVRLLFIGVLIYSGYTLAHQQYIMAQKRKTAAACETQISDAKNENARLKEESEMVNTREYKEQKAREYLGYVKSDERIYIDVTK